MKTREIIDALGFMAGIIAGHFLLTALGVGDLVRIIGTIVIGLAGGFVAEKIYAAHQAPRDDPRDGDENDSPYE